MQLSYSLEGFTLIFHYVAHGYHKLVVVNVEVKPSRLLSACSFLPRAALRLPPVTNIGKPMCKAFQASCCDYFTMIFLPLIRFYGCGLTILVDHFCGLSISFLLILPPLHAVHQALRQQAYWLAKVQVRRYALATTAGWC